MRKFSSYGPLDKELEYYAPREALIGTAVERLVGENPDKGGHYITVWAPRQAGKSWILLEAIEQIRATEKYEVATLTMQSGKTITTDERILGMLVKSLRNWFDLDFPDITRWDELEDLFTNTYFSKPLILVLDEFDALEEDFINKFANEFRKMYMNRRDESHKKSEDKKCLLHGLALISVRSVLGIENVSGSPFNVQRSMHIPNLTFEEVAGLFHSYERESEQKVASEVVERLYYETRGQPGLTCWFGELLTETYNKQKPEIIMKDFDRVLSLATHALPNNNILNIISKAKQEPYKELLLELFKTGKKIPFRYDDVTQNYLYMNGVIDRESTDESSDDTKNEQYIRFPCPFTQRRLFSYFSHEIFDLMDGLYGPFEDISGIITEEEIHIKNLLLRYQAYLQKHSARLLKDAPRRADLRIYEAVFHFNLYMYLYSFLMDHKGQVLPEFPTGNGQVDLIIKYAGRVYGLELKSYTNERGYNEALQQAARYAHSLGLEEITLVFFVESVDDLSRAKFEAAYSDENIGVRVIPVFVETGSLEGEIV